MRIEKMDTENAKANLLQLSLSFWSQSKTHTRNDQLGVNMVHLDRRNKITFMALVTRTGSKLKQYLDKLEVNEKQQEATQIGVIEFNYIDENKSKGSTNIEIKNANYVGLTDFESYMRKYENEEIIPGYRFLMFTGEIGTRLQELPNIHARPRMDVYKIGDSYFMFTYRIRTKKTKHLYEIPDYSYMEIKGYQPLVPFFSHRRGTIDRFGNDRKLTSLGSLEVARKLEKVLDKKAGKTIMKSYVFTDRVLGEKETELTDNTNMMFSTQTNTLAFDKDGTIHLIKDGQFITKEDGDNVSMVSTLCKENKRGRTKPLNMSDL